MQNADEKLISTAKIEFETPLEQILSLQSLKIGFEVDFSEQNEKSRMADFSSWLNGVMARFFKN